MKQTGQCYWRDEAGVLWLACSYEDENGVVSTQNVEVQEGQTVQPVSFASAPLTVISAPKTRPWYWFLMFWKWF